MTKFKQGNIIEQLTNCSGAQKGQLYILTHHSSWDISEEESLFATDKITGATYCNCQYNWKLIKNKTKKKHQVFNI